MSLEEKYKKENLQTHIYNTPDTYVGGCDLICEKLFIYDSKNDKIVEKEIEYIPALFNIYNEILVNAKDHCTRLNGLYIKDKSVNAANGPKFYLAQAYLSFMWPAPLYLVLRIMEYI